MRLRLFKRRTLSLWLPTWPVLVGLVLVAAAGCFVCVKSLYPFLAKTEKVSGELLVLEGWTHEYNFEPVIAEFEAGGYEHLCVTGANMSQGTILSDYVTFADATGATLLKLGADESKLVIASAEGVFQHRSYRSALFLKRRLEERGIEYTGIDVYTMTAHARRSQLVYEKVFGDSVRIGVVSLPSRNFDPKRWWASSTGGKHVLIELIAYVREKFFNSGRSEADEVLE